MVFGAVRRGADLAVAEHAVQGRGIFGAPASGLPCRAAQCPASPTTRRRLRLTVQGMVFGESGVC